MKYLSALFILLLLITSLSCGDRKRSVYRKTMPLMDTIVSISVVSGSKDEAERGMDKAFAAIDRFGTLINFFSEKSELSEINRNAGTRETRVSPETIDVIEMAVITAEKSGGAFDPSIGPVVKLWDFLKRKKPGGEEIRRVLPLIDFRNIVIDRQNSTVFLKNKGMLLDLGGIAKGYAADLAADTLIKSGIRDGLVSIAGDIRTFGVKPDNSPWTIGIKNPRQTGEKDEIIARIRLSGKAISTAGDYERFFIDDNRRYHHLLDPETGYPAGLCRSVSVIAGKAALTDAVSTAVFILGPEKGLKLAQDMGMDAIIIDSSGTIHSTPGIKDILSIEKGN
jgi:thiamine biosynthesis lipoprotein